MSAVSSIRVEAREKVGKGSSHALRRQGFIPGILYGAKKENVALKIDPRDVIKGLSHPGFFSTIYDLKIGGATEKALARQVQFDPVTDRPLHVDFLRVNKDTKVHVHIPILFKNEEECPGITRGGVLNIVRHTLELSCTADHIPESIILDLTGLEIGDSIHAANITLPAGVTLTHMEKDDTVATIVAPVLKTEEEELAEQAAAEAASAAALAGESEATKGEEEAAPANSKDKEK